jgi:uncharacterized short protein YbdD (DUF466 family)
LASDHQDFVERMRDKIPGRPVPSKGQWRKVKEKMEKGAEPRGAPVPTEKKLGP